MNSEVINLFKSTKEFEKIINEHLSACVSRNRKLNNQLERLSDNLDEVKVSVNKVFFNIRE